ncbi:MAG TPA: hypothetical protein VGL09_13170 [Methylomirabilota bacterium]|jgi:hypothetical protein
MVAPLLGLLALVEGGMAPVPAPQGVELVLTLVIFGAMALWVRGNRMALTTAPERRRAAVPRPPNVIHPDVPAQAIPAVATLPVVEAFAAAVNQAARLRTPRGGAA